MRILVHASLLLLGFGSRAGVMRVLLVLLLLSMLLLLLLAQSVVGAVLRA
jgi:ABC-type branched-subunit amino acid transport system permease subunit